MKMPFSKKLTTGESFPLGCADAFNALYERTYLVVFRYAFGLHGGPAEDVEDLTTETFLRAWKSRHRFRGDENAALGWLLTIARNLVIDTQRRRNRSGFEVDIERHILAEPGLSPEDQIAYQDQVKTLWRLLANLSVQQREIIVLRYLTGWSVKRIAQHLDMKENTVSVYIRRILLKLRENWPEKETSQK